MNKKVSIVIPIYNVELYLDECLNSLKIQTYTNFEVILINDGSTDNSLSICEKFCKEDKRFKYYSIENNGVSNARNLGISKASGEYLIFLDPDDFVEKEFILSLIKTYEEKNVELVLCKYNKFYSHSHIEKEDWFIKDGLFNKTDVNKILIPSMIGPEDLNENNKTIMGSIWRMIIKKETIESLGLRFDPKIPLMEDLLFIIKLLTQIETVYILDKYLYNYRFVGNSAVNKYREDFKQIQKNVESNIEEVLKELLIKVPEVSFSYSNRIFNSTVWILLNESKNTFFKNKYDNFRSIMNDKDIAEFFSEVTYKQFNFNKKILVFILKIKSPILLDLYFKLLNLVKR